jgi:hypothetical protein
VASSTMAPKSRVAKAAATRRHGTGRNTIATPAPPDDWIKSVVKVGGGCGFVVETKDQDRLIITAGHCLPKLPPSHPASYTKLLFAPSDA